jgi:plasmid stabilization system protein ParE
MRPIVFLDEAREEAIEAFLYCEKRAAGLGVELLRQVRLAIQQIAKFPEAGALADAKTRRRLVRRFPYGIFYRIEAEHIVVVAVGDLRRRPGYWRGRG